MNKYLLFILSLTLLSGCHTPQDTGSAPDATITLTLARYDPTCPCCGNHFVSSALEWYSNGGSTVMTNNVPLYNLSQYTIWFRCPNCKRKFSANSTQTNALPENLYPINVSRPPTASRSLSTVDPPVSSSAAMSTPPSPPITTQMELGLRRRYKVDCTVCFLTQIGMPVSQTYLSQGTDTTNVFTLYKLLFRCENQRCRAEFICHTKVTESYPKMVYPIDIGRTKLSPPYPPKVVRVMSPRLPQPTMPDHRPEPRVWAK